MFWSAGDRIGFVWEGDGWRHLYAVSASGGRATLLTPGDGEIETAALTADGRHIVYSTNIGDLGRRHIAQAGFDGASPRSLTSGEKDQWAPVPLANGRARLCRGRLGRSRESRHPQREWIDKLRTLSAKSPHPIRPH